jgi:hypothetical protein
VYEITFNISLAQYFYIVDHVNTGDIIIDSIELVQKPLPKLTINGVDGFTSGKWTIDNKFTVIDDETLYFDGSTLSVSAYATFDFDTAVGQSYVLSFANPTPNSSTIWDVRTLPVDGSYGSTSTGQTSFSFTATTNRTRIRARVNVGAVAHYYKRPMLNVGLSPVPYSRKTGDRMVLPTPKKNLFNKLTASADGFRVDAGTGTVLTSSGNSYSDWITIKPNTRYTASNLNILGDATGHHCAFYDVNKTYISGVVSSSLTSPSNAVYLRISFTTSLKDLVQLEEGNTATSYEPYNVQLNKKPNHAIAKERSGMAFNGVTDYLQLPSMTMDSIEIDCLVDSAQPSSDYRILDARPGLATGYFNTGNTGFDFMYVDGVLKPNKLYTDVPKNVRTKVKVVSNTAFTDDINVFGTGSISQKLKGTLYKVTCYLNGGVVAQYDFENPSNVVGNTVLPKADNLIPSFEDPRWTLHVNTQVLGKNVLRLNSTGSNQSSFIDLPAQPNEVYYGQMLVNTGDVFIRIRDINNTQIDTFWPTLTKKTLPANAASLRIEMRNIGAVGTFDFAIPKLFKLDGKEATLNGTPVQLNKSIKRTLYAKR